MICSGLPSAPGAATVIVSTYTPAARPTEECCQRTLPSPVPVIGLRIVVPASFFDTDHTRLPAPGPVNRTRTESAAPVRLGNSESTRTVALSPTLNAVGAVTCSVSMMRAGEPIMPGALMTMVSTYVPGVSPAVSDRQRNLLAPVPIGLMMRILRGRAQAVHAVPASRVRLAESSTRTPGALTVCEVERMETESAAMGGRRTVMW